MLSQRLPLKFKAPRVVLENTRTFETAQELLTAWQTNREDLRVFLEAMPDEYVRKKIYKHVRVGMLNTQHALIFNHEHYRHHLPQINAILYLLNKPR